MKRAQATAALAELRSLRDRAERLADELDPDRTFGGRDELTRTVVRACDAMMRQATQAIAVLELDRRHLPLEEAQ